MLLKAVIPPSGSLQIRYKYGIIYGQHLPDLEEQPTQNSSPQKHINIIILNIEYFQQQILCISSAGIPWYNYLAQQIMQYLNYALARILYLLFVFIQQQNISIIIFMIQTCFLIFFIVILSLKFLIVCIYNSAKLKITQASSVGQNGLYFKYAQKNPFETFFLYILYLVFIFSLDNHISMRTSIFVLVILLFLTTGYCANQIVTLESGVDDRFVYKIGYFIYGTNHSQCYKYCRRGEICTVKSLGRNRFNTTCKPYCRDGIIVGAENCDDGNVKSGDGCSFQCKIQRTWVCTGTPSVCVNVCGNGQLDLAAFQQCDDGNQNNGDGCTNKCKKQTGWTCTQVNRVKSICTQICGDGMLVGRQKSLANCDDGNTRPGDGCSSICKREKNYLCYDAPSRCVNQCNNGIWNDQADEECDNGYSSQPDGCSNDCNFQPYFQCKNVMCLPTVCTPICGDGVIVGTQKRAGRCDDNNSDQGDGCSPQCIVNIGYQCSGEPSICNPICGDGLLTGNQLTLGHCDDGNTNLGDGCENCNTTRLYSCINSPSQCTYLCGNKKVNLDVGQFCDNGDSINQDGCSNQCRIDTGWQCTAESFKQSICTPICGDGKAYGSELQSGNCDDGNQNNNDGCSNSCKVNSGYSCTSTKGAQSICRLL